VSVSLIILDDFYNNPDEVREFALSQVFSDYTYRFGKITSPHITDDIKEIIERIIFNYAGEVTSWDDSLSGSFCLATQEDRDTIKANESHGWTGVCYRTPNAPVTSGVGIFKHVKTNRSKIPKNLNGEINSILLEQIYRDSKDITKWEPMDVSVNVYNRLFLFRSDLFHMLINPFGNNLQNCGLYQSFFFSTEF